MIKNRSKPTSGEFWWILGPRTVNFGPFGAAAGAPAESATGALAFYVLTLLDAKSRERVNSDLTQVGIGTQLDSFLLIVVQTSLPQPGSLTIVIVIVIIIIIVFFFFFFILYHHICVCLIFWSPPSCFLSGHSVANGVDCVHRWGKKPQMLQAHAFMISHCKMLLARGGREVPATHHYMIPSACCRLLLGSPAPLVFWSFFGRSTPHCLKWQCFWSGICDKNVQVHRKASLQVQASKCLVVEVHVLVGQRWGLVLNVHCQNCTARQWCKICFTSQNVKAKCQIREMPDSIFNLECKHEKTLCAKVPSQQSQGGASPRLISPWLLPMLARWVHQGWQSQKSFVPTRCLPGSFRTTCLSLPLSPSTELLPQRCNSGKQWQKEL